MKTFISILILTVFIAACDSGSANYEEKPNPGVEAFKTNSEVVKAYLDSWTSESLDYSVFSDDYANLGTSFGETDSTNLEQMKEWDMWAYQTFDFKVVTDPLVLLPGVNADTKEIDGSVRTYYEMEITKVATDSTTEKTGVLQMYQTYEFNEEGKIYSHTTYGDFGGLMQYLNSSDEEY